MGGDWGRGHRWDWLREGAWSLVGGAWEHYGMWAGLVGGVVIAGRGILGVLEGWAGLMEGAWSGMGLARVGGLVIGGRGLRNRNVGGAYEGGVVIGWQCLGAWSRWAWLLGGAWHDDGGAYG